MNPAQNQMPGPGQPQQNVAGTAAQQQAQQPQQPVLYHPEQIKNMPELTDEERNKYAVGLETLWRKVKSTPQESPDHKQARDKIMSFSKMLAAKLEKERERKKSLADEGKIKEEGGQQQPGLAQVAQQQNAQQARQPTQSAPQAQGQLAATNQGANGGAIGQAGAQASNQTQQQASRLPDSIMAHLRTLSFKPQPALMDKSNAEAQKWIADMKGKYGRALYSIENNKGRIKAIDKQIAARQQAGNPFSEEDKKKLNEQKAQNIRYLQEATKWAENFRKQHLAEQPANSVQTTDAARPNTPAAAQMPTQGANSATAASTDAPKVQPQQAAAAVTTPAQASTVPANNAQVPLQTANNSVPSSQPTPAQIQAQRMQQQQAQQLQQQQQQAAAVNNAQMAQQQQAPVAPSQPARVQTPQSTTPVHPPGVTRALSHSAAMTLANQRATAGSAPPQGQQPGAQGQQPGAQGQQPGGAGTPTSAAGAGGSQQPPGQQPPAAQPHQHMTAQHQQQPQHGHPHAHPSQQQATMQSKMPIPKQLPDKATAVPQGVALGGGIKPGRPTVSQGSGTLGGVMNQPAINRIPAFNNEAESDHVLSKKKLDELVRQVCGGSSSEGQEGNLLAPEVEENVLNMADSFIDNVLHVACRNAKERGSKVLEIRDIQLVLERTYNIRVPGYSSDELRTVRKVQPSAGWIAKMSAVQAAKVMPGKGE